MRITFCGTAAGAGTHPDRAGAAIHLAHEGSEVLLDCGPASLQQMARARLDPTALQAVVLSHLHFDHAIGIIELLARLSLRRAALPSVYGPAETDEYVRAAVAFAHLNAAPDDPDVHQRLDAMDVQLTRPDDERDLAGMRMVSRAVPHVEYLECLARRFEAGGRTMVYSGDSSYAPEVMAPLAEGANLLIHEAYTEQAVEAFAAPMPAATQEQMQAIFASVHCRADDVGRLAAAAGVERLVLTHLIEQEREEELLAQAGAHFSGEIIVAQDGLLLEV